ncbi:MAG: WecB/TagA/CpsF family glycosyltransferase [Candidatus Obscuribacterales bacterium]|nr:WecB/TagA/CpsF family glycosyltransferase [Candidatus Obscuribacterales bacterium]
MMSTLSITNRSRQKVLGYPVDVVDESKAVAVIEDAWARHRGMHVVTLNAEMVVAAQQDAELDRIVRHAHLIVPDGAGVVWAVKMNGQDISRVPGIELAAAALASAAKHEKRVALIGGKPEVMERLLEVLPQRYPGINIVASHNGYFTIEDEENVVDEIAAHQPDLVLVALGVPKQEYFIDRWGASFTQSVKVGVGGSFDVWTGQVKRAPALMRKLNLEWFYRLVSEPWRFKRIMSALPNFFFQVLHEAVFSPSSGRPDESKEQNDSSGNDK